jgi:hypothetical protein
LKAVLPGPIRRDPLLGAKRLQLGEREVLGEEALERRAVDHLGLAAARELRV